VMQCRHVSEKSGTFLKGLDELKRDGGWMEFGKYFEARRFFSEHFQKFKFVQCG
jgi:hypothetical protein